MLHFDYDALSKGFNIDLNDKLRSHAARHDSLALWVTSEDIVEGLSNLIESAITYGETHFTVSVRDGPLSNARCNQIISNCENIAVIQWSHVEHEWQAEVKNRQVSGQKKQSVVTDKLAEETSVDVSYHYGISYALEVPLCLRQALESLSGNTTAMINSFPPEFEVVSSRHNKLAFKLDEKNIVTDCLFQTDTQSDFLTGSLNLLATYARGHPLRQIIDHGLNEIIGQMFSRLSTEDKNRMPAIPLPFNLGPEFVEIHELLGACRQQLSGQLDLETYNEFEAPISENWAGLTKSKRFENISAAIVRFCQEEGQYANGIVLSELENDLSQRPVRVFVHMIDDIDVSERPTIIRQLEQYLKQSLEKQLQVYYVEVKDANRIRRLS